MERNIMLWICALVIVHPIVHGNQEKRSSTVSDKLPSLLRMNNDFAFHLYKRLVEMPQYQSKNIFFSPFSVSMAISELTLGAGGETKHQLLNGFGYSSSFFSTEEMHELFHSLLEDIDHRTGVDIDVGTALYVSDKFKLIPKSLENLKQFYYSDGFVVNFGKKETLNEINTYVKEKTHGKIDKAVEDLDADTLMFLLTYIYFKGKWDMAFNPSKTMEDMFYVDDETTVSVKFMHQYDFVNVYYDMDLSTKVLSLDYSDSFSMLLVIPQYGPIIKNITYLEKEVSRGQIKKWMGAVSKRKVDIYVPKLSLKTSYSLKDILRGMGITDMFTNKADFSGFSDERMFISKAVHQASLDIDEEGTTAAAVTTVQFRPMSYHPLMPIRFDRPFMIFIIDQKNDNILFIGKIENPTEGIDAVLRS